MGGSGSSLPDIYFPLNAVVVVVVVVGIRFVGSNLQLHKRKGCPLHTCVKWLGCLRKGGREVGGSVGGGRGSSMRVCVWSLRQSPCDDVPTLPGTTTNQTSVITFKRGAFVAGTPVQPVACRMRWANMDPAWVNDGPSQYVVLLRLMAQVTNYVRSSCSHSSLGHRHPSLRNPFHSLSWKAVMP